MSPMRFLADMNLATEVAVWLRTQGHDAIHLGEVELQALGDQAVVAKAIAEKRVVVTIDLDFADIAAAAGAAPVAVILLRLRSAQTARVVDRLRGILAAVGPALEQGAVVVVEEQRVRVRRLPDRPLKAWSEDSARHLVKTGNPAA